jgi:hypothetical protein
MPRGDLTQPDAAHSSIKTDMEIIRKTVELVLVPVTVMDEAPPNRHLARGKQFSAS